MVTEVQILYSGSWFQKIFTSYYVFLKWYVKCDFLILHIYVDDILIVEQENEKITGLKNNLS